MCERYRLIKDFTEIKVLFTRVRTNFCTDKTCTVPACVYTEPAELDKYQCASLGPAFFRSQTCTLSRSNIRPVPPVPCNRKVEPCKFLSVQKFVLTRVNGVLAVQLFVQFRRSRVNARWNRISFCPCKNLSRHPCKQGQSRPALYFSQQFSSTRNNFFSLRDKLNTQGDKRETCNETMSRDKLRVFFISHVAAFIHFIKFLSTCYSIFWWIPS